MKDIFGPKIDAWIRHGISGVVPWLVAYGAQPELVEKWVSSSVGLVTTFASFGVALGWSLLEKKLKSSVKF